MKIIDVKLFIPTEDQQKMGGKKTFKVTFDNGDRADVPILPDNRHYWEVKQWYADNKLPWPFDDDTLKDKEQ